MRTNKNLPNFKSINCPINHEFRNVKEKDHHYYWVGGTHGHFDCCQFIYNIFLCNFGLCTNDESFVNLFEKISIFVILSIFFLPSVDWRAQKCRKIICNGVSSIRNILSWLPLQLFINGIWSRLKLVTMVDTDDKNVWT